MVTYSDNIDMPVKSGGTKITDFEDLRIAFLDLQEKHNTLVNQHKELARNYNKYRKEHVDRDIATRMYGL